jgi:hypothetical protein
MQNTAPLFMLDPRIESKLKQSGFWRIKNAPQFMAYAPQGTDAICNASNWFLTRGDSDVSIFEEPNLG